MKYPSVMHFSSETKCNLQESIVNEDLQRDDDKLTSYEGYDVSEVI